MAVEIGVAAVEMEHLALILNQFEGVFGCVASSVVNLFVGMFESVADWCGSSGGSRNELIGAYYRGGRPVSL